MNSSFLVICDRDGVLNKMVIDSNHGTIDSPLHPSQVEVYPEAVEALALLTAAGVDVSIASNQPSWAQGKTTRANLESVHQKIIEQLEAKGGKVRSSHICFHKSEDFCPCRKPRTGLLEAAFANDSKNTRANTWMVGDGVTDIQAGTSFGLKTAFLGPKKIETRKVFEEIGISPLFWGMHILEFAVHLLNANPIGAK